MRLLWALLTNIRGSERQNRVAGSTLLPQLLLPVLARDALCSSLVWRSRGGATSPPGGRPRPLRLSSLQVWSWNPGVALY